RVAAARARRRYTADAPGSPEAQRIDQREIEILSTLGRNAVPMRVTQPALPADAPVRPDPGRDALLVALLVLLGGSAIVLARGLLDRSPRRADPAQEPAPTRSKQAMNSVPRGPYAASSTRRR
ncbi:MAG TPA: hypothetical protein VGI54_09345, partial [Solirubrobacteraceae bacterium]